MLSIVIIYALLVLLGLLDLLDFDWLLSIFITLLLVIFFVQCDSGWPFCKHLTHCIFSQYFLSYLGSCLFTVPPLWDNGFPYDGVCWITLDLVNLSRSMRFPCMFLGHWSSPVVKLFLNLLLIFYVEFHYSREKYMRGTFTRFPLLLPVFYLD